jgi:hypothetical protein
MRNRRRQKTREKPILEKYGEKEVEAMHTKRMRGEAVV